jgi:hypothetical protein
VASIIGGKYICAVEITPGKKPEVYCENIEKPGEGKGPSELKNAIRGLCAGRSASTGAVRKGLCPPAPVCPGAAPVEAGAGSVTPWFLKSFMQSIKLGVDPGGVAQLINKALKADTYKGRSLNENDKEILAKYRDGIFKPQTPEQIRNEKRTASVSSLESRLVIAAVKAAAKPPGPGYSWPTTEKVFTAIDGALTKALTEKRFINILGNEAKGPTWDHTWTEVESCGLFISIFKKLRTLSDVGNKSRFVDTAEVILTADTWRDPQNGEPTKNPYKKAYLEYLKIAPTKVKPPDIVYSTPPISNCRDFKAAIQKGAAFSEESDKNIYKQMKRTCNNCVGNTPSYDPISPFCTMCCKDIQKIDNMAEWRKNLPPAAQTNASQTNAPQTNAPQTSKKYTTLPGYDKTKFGKYMKRNFFRKPLFFWAMMNEVTQKEAKPPFKPQKDAADPEFQIWIKETFKKWTEGATTLDQKTLDEKTFKGFESYLFKKT